MTLVCGEFGGMNWEVLECLYISFFSWDFVQLASISLVLDTP